MTTKEQLDKMMRDRALLNRGMNRPTIIHVLNDFWLYSENYVFELQTERDWDAVVFSYNSVVVPACLLSR